MHQGRIIFHDIKILFKSNTDTRLHLSFWSAVRSEILRVGLLVKKLWEKVPLEIVRSKGSQEIPEFHRKRVREREVGGFIWSTRVTGTGRAEEPELLHGSSEAP